MPVYRKLWFWIVVLIILSPLGLLAKGTAWGEWGSDELKEMLGMVPEGLAKLEETWHALLPDYSIPGFDKTFAQQAVGYIVAAVVGVVLIALVAYLLGRLLARSEK
ncbi:PDGLE domain-containing protein [Ammonifex thiophilus]|uniref:Cobalamin biosynthesis protein n=1 Tax=Ammonifex thiophilus TaxID=444093 RepID=A0A3D8P7A7_9THEO|nr:PDGLE domain-containing protein [Ammonifex thiophilus]RDV84742.1 cobalamin biosynthesis protein [Ammonifex thiophilus]